MRHFTGRQLAWAAVGLLVLAPAGATADDPYLARWLSDPEAPRPSAHMPKLELDPAQIEALAAYLATLR